MTHQAFPASFTATPHGGTPALFTGHRSAQPKDFAIHDAGRDPIGASDLFSAIALVVAQSEPDGTQGILIPREPNPCYLFIRRFAKSGSRHSQTGHPQKRIRLEIGWTGDVLRPVITLKVPEAECMVCFGLALYIRDNADGAICRHT